VTTATFEVPAIVEDALAAAARRRLPPEFCGGAALTAAIVDRSRRYTSEREHLATPGAGKASLADLAARALFFTIADAAKVHLPLAELLDGVVPAPAGSASALFSRDELRVLDIGAGCGAMTIGLCTFLAARDLRPRVRVTLVDQDVDALAIAKDALATIARGLGVEVSVMVRVADVGVGGGEAEGDGDGDGARKTGGAARGHDLVIAGSVLNELADPLPLARTMISALAPGGVAIIIEPALRTTTRALHRVRDAMIETSAATVLAPCTRKTAPCPALLDENDWCHEHRPLVLPPRARQLAHVTGLRDGDMKLAYLTLCRAEDAPPPRADDWRVVSDPHPSKGKLEMTLCGAAGWVPARLLKRHRSATNKLLERAHRGDIFAIAPSPTADAPDVTAESTVIRRPGD
jgi:ribosomal protein RSM22 (predicted rRNA methylase)